MERPCPAEPADNSITILFAWGAMFFASARAIEDLLPKADQAKRAVVILRLRGRSRTGSTFVQILERYATKLQANGGKLVLSGVSQHVWKQLERTETFETIPQEDVFLATDTLGQSTLDAMEAAKQWLAQTALSQDEQKSENKQDVT